MRTPLLVGSGAALLGALALWGCGGASSPSSPSSPSAGAQTVTVSIVASVGNTAYRPNPVTANAGDTVMFRNNDGTMHHIVMDDGSADLGDIGPGATSRGLTLKNASPLNYHCTVHPSMVGSINGASAPVPPDCRDPYGYSC